MDLSTLSTFDEQLRLTAQLFSFWSPEQCHAAMQHISNLCCPEKFRALHDAMSHRGCKDFVSELPSEIAINILSHLDFDSLLKAPLVCRAWNDLANDDRLWKKLWAESPWQLTNAEEEERCLDWKGLYLQRLFLERNWLLGQYC
eukprot:Colp12_sorted_trinity150504_noHs@6053